MLLAFMFNVTPILEVLRLSLRDYLPALAVLVSGLLL